MKAAFVGFGELGQQLFRFASIQFTLDTIAIFDDQYRGNLGPKFSFSSHADEKYVDYSFFIGLGYKHLMAKQEIIGNLIAKGRSLPNLFHPSSFIAPSAKFAHATYIYPMCNVDKDVVVESGVLLNNSVTISHNSKIGQCSYLSPGVVLSGCVEIGSRVFMGSGSLCANGITVGDDVVCGIGTTIIDNVRNGAHIIGNPMRYLDKKITLK